MMCARVAIFAESGAQRRFCSRATSHDALQGHGRAPSATARARNAVKCASIWSVHVAKRGPLEWGISLLHPRGEEWQAVEQRGARARQPKHGGRCACARSPACMRLRAFYSHSNPTTSRLARPGRFARQDSTCSARQFLLCNPLTPAREAKWHFRPCEQRPPPLPRAPGHTTHIQTHTHIHTRTHDSLLLFTCSRLSSKTSTAYLTNRTQRALQRAAALPPAPVAASPRALAAMPLRAPARAAASPVPRGAAASPPAAAEAAAAAAESWRAQGRGG